MSCYAAASTESEHLPVSLELAVENLMSPMVLAFVLGIVAAAARADIAFPKGLSDAMSAYLLLAIGWKGGTALADSSFTAIIGPALVTLAIGVVTPVVAFAVLRRLSFGRTDAAAIAAHYGSVSAVTFAAALTFLQAAGYEPEGFMATLLALLEVPGIVVALVLAQGAAASPLSATREALLGKGVVLLLGGIVLGALASEPGATQVSPFFDGLFFGVLTLFLLDLGIVAAKRARDLRSAGWRLVAFALVFPVVFGSLGVVLGTMTGLSIGGAALLGTMAGSSSYIAATAAVRASLPEASPSLYLGASLGVTFPFNLTIGIPLYTGLAVVLG